MKKAAGRKEQFYVSGLEEGEAAAKAVSEAAAAIVPELAEQQLFCRLAVHEAVLNALRHGGGEAFVSFFPEDGGVRVQIRQNKDVLFPEPSKAFGGMALIRRCSRKQHVSENKKILSLWFY